MGRIIPIIWKQKKMFQTTNQKVIGLINQKCFHELVRWVGPRILTDVCHLQRALQWQSDIQNLPNIPLW